MNLHDTSENRAYNVSESWRTFARILKLQNAWSFPKLAKLSTIGLKVRFSNNVLEFTVTRHTFRKSWDTNTTVVPGVVERWPAAKLTLSSPKQFNVKSLAVTIRATWNGFWIPNWNFREINLETILGYDFVQSHKSWDPLTASGKSRDNRSYDFQCEIRRISD